MSALDAAVVDDRALLAAVARAYYLEDLSRVEIAERFAITRFKVTRLLTRARAEGIVSIEIHDHGLPDLDLSARLKDALGLDSCIVVRSHGDDDTVRRQIGAAASAHLSSTLSAGEVLGLTWGRTLTATTSQLTHLPRLTIVQLTGSVGGDIASSPIEIARQASKRSGGDVYPIFAPMFVQDAETAASLRSHPDIRAAMDLAPSVTTAVLSVGVWDPPDSQVREVLPAADVEHALARGCVGDIAGILVDAEGVPVDPEFQKRCITIEYDQLRAVPRVVVVAGGAAKAPAIQAVTKGGLVSELVTDHALALAVLGSSA